MPIGPILSLGFLQLHRLDTEGVYKCRVPRIYSFTAGRGDRLLLWPKSCKRQQQSPRIEESTVNVVLVGRFNNLPVLRLHGNKCSDNLGLHLFELSSEKLEPPEYLDDHTPSKATRGTER